MGSGPETGRHEWLRGAFVDAGVSTELRSNTGFLVRKAPRPRGAGAQLEYTSVLNLK